MHVSRLCERTYRIFRGEVAELHVHGFRLRLRPARHHLPPVSTSSGMTPLAFAYAMPFKADLLAICLLCPAHTRPRGYTRIRRVAARARGRDSARDPSVPAHRAPSTEPLEALRLDFLVVAEVSAPKAAPGASRRGSVRVGSQGCC